MIARLSLLFSLLMLVFAFPAQAAVQIGQIAPDFTLNGADGTPHRLSDFKGKTVVLEWTNPGCPYVKKHYESGTMQKLQKDAMTEYSVVWLRINSSAEGKEGYLDADAARKLLMTDGSAQTAYLLDADGKVGHLYDARTTPHMFVVDANGTLVYMGAIDDAPSADAASLQNAKSYIREALDDIRRKQPVRTAVTQPYGCGVKYSD